MKLRCGTCFGALLLLSCGTAGEATRKDRAPGTTMSATGEGFYEEGRQFFRAGEFDSAVVYFERSLAVDSAYAPALKDLGQIYYQDGLTGGGGFRSALLCYRRLESGGDRREEVYDRLTEITQALGERELFLMYARRQAEAFPGDREVYNLGLAYFELERYQDVIESQKSAIAQFGHSPHVAGYYRLLGDAYFAVDRQQTAERTYEQGVAAADERVGFFSAADPDFRSGATYQHLDGNRRSMLAALRKIYRLHGKTEKLQEVERRLDEMR